MNYRICMRCVMDTSDPDIEFDSAGRCNHCIAAEAEIARDWKRGPEGVTELRAVADQIRREGEGRDYDCILGLSGGIDSSYLMHVAVRELGLRPLAVHVDAGWNSEIAVRNIELLVRKLGVDLHTCVVNWQEVRDLQVAFLKAGVANQDTPQDHVFFSELYRLSTRHGIRWVLTGNNLATESILPSSWGYDATDGRHVRAIHQRFGSGKLNAYPTMSLLRYYIWWPFINRMKRVSPLNFMEYDKGEAVELLKSEYGWKDYGGKHRESRFTSFFQSVYLPQKFGYDKRRAHWASSIMSGNATREEALEALVQPPVSETDARSEKRFVAKKLGLSEEEIDTLINQPNRHYSDYPNNAGRVALLRRVRALVTGRR